MQRLFHRVPPQLFHDDQRVSAELRSRGPGAARPAQMLKLFEARSLAAKRALAALANGRIPTEADAKRLRLLWQTLVRDSSHQSDRFPGFCGTYGYTGPQPFPNLESSKVREYISRSIEMRRKFAQTWRQASSTQPQEFRNWLQALHQIQNYKERCETRWNSITYRLRLEGLVPELRRIASRMGVPLTAGGVCQPQRVPGISETAWPNYQAYESGIFWYSYAPTEARPQYLARAQQELQKLSKLPLHVAPELVVEHVARFYYLSVATHPFATVNHSLFMNASNVLLELFGLSGIEHGIIDYVAWGLPHDAFVRYFVAQVAARNPQRMAHLSAGTTSAQLSA